MAVSGETLTILGTILGVGLALAALIMRGTSRLDADRRDVQQRFDADRRETQRRFDIAMDAFRSEMRALAQRQSHVEGRLDGRAAAD